MDLYTVVAAQVFDVDPENVTDEMRDQVKAQALSDGYSNEAIGIHCPFQHPLSKEIFNTLMRSLTTFSLSINAANPEGFAPEIAFQMHDRLKDAFEIAADVELRFAELQNSNPMAGFVSALQRHAEGEKKKREKWAKVEDMSDLLLCKKCMQPMLIVESMQSGRKKAKCPECGETRMIQVPEQEA